MATAFFPVVMEPDVQSFDPTDVADQSTLDLNDLTDCSDQLGTVCGVHHTARFIDEAPLVHVGHIDGSVKYAKSDLFPHSWTAIATQTPVTRGGWFSRTSRPRTVTVRYCPACRMAAEEWQREYLASQASVGVGHAAPIAA
jgi:hypothetical protein